MTCKEKWEMEHPGLSFGDSRDNLCPSHYTYLGDPVGCCVSINCTDCWNREIPEESESKKTVELGEKVAEGFTKGDEADPSSNRCFTRLMAKSNNAVEKIKDSGDRTEFESGAVRDMHEGKGRCDLMPLDVIEHLYAKNCIVWAGYSEVEEPVRNIFDHLHAFQDTGDVTMLYCVIDDTKVFDDRETMLLEVAKHFEDGCKKYGENNWRKGIPAHCYIDSAIRHYLKCLRGDKDERHDRAFVWNILCCIWTCEHIPELNDYKKEK